MSNLTDWIGMEEFEKLTLRGRQNLQTGGGQPTWQLRSKILGVFIITNRLASQRASYSNHLRLHTLSHKFLYGSHIYAMLCHEWAAATARRRRAASSTTAAAAAPRPLQCYSSRWYWSAAASSSSAAKLKVDHSTASANVTDHWS